MTLVIELEQCFHSIAQMERRVLNSGLKLPNEWFFHKQEAWQKVSEEEDPNRCPHRSHGEATLNSGLKLPNEWFFHKQEAWQKVAEEEDPNCTITNMCSAGNAVTC
jgi:hypothetical protein